MPTNDRPIQSNAAIGSETATVFVSLELSRSRWLMTSLSPGSEKMSKHWVAGGDGDGLLDLLERSRDKAEQRTGTPVEIVVIQEAGRDGFWIHRLLVANGIESHVVEIGVDRGAQAPPARQDRHNRRHDAPAHTHGLQARRATLRIYQHPATVFCGSFIGNPPMNFLPAERADGGWRVGDALLDGPAHAPAKLLMGIRPEDLQVVDGAAASRLSGRVGVVEPLGPTTLLTVQIGDRTIRLAATPDIAARPGDAIHLEPRADRVRWFDAETEKALGA